MNIKTIIDTIEVEGSILNILLFNAIDINSIEDPTLKQLFQHAEMYLNLYLEADQKIEQYLK